MRFPHRMSYSDAFDTVTGDPEFWVLESMLAIEWIAQRSA